MILEYWVQWLFGSILALLGFGYRKIAQGIKGEREEQRQMKQALLAILHDRLYQECKVHLKEGEISVEALKNLEYLYNGYHALGGNSTGTELYERTKKLPIKQKEN